jgi:hypothetical protein
MKYTKFFSVIALLFILNFDVAYAQLKEMEPSKYDYTGNVVKPNEYPTRVGNLGEQKFHFSMNQSYSMNFMTGFGGAANINAYTNVMNFGYGERLSGQVALSLLHSPFGSSLGPQGVYGQNNSVNFVVQNAEFTYKLSENAYLQFGFSQMPRNQFGFGQNGFSSWGRDPFTGRWN